jgi:signal transduction histidine kinase
MLQNAAGYLSLQDQDFLQRILLNAKDQLRLINGVLDLSKVEAGRMDLQVDEIAVEALISDVVKQFDGEQRNPKVELIMRLPKASAPLRTDAARLKQILVNLIDNALKFTPQGAVIVEMTVSPLDHRPLRIDVTDTGIGIPRERIGDIFEPFHQLEDSQRLLQGSGLGLSICRSLCELMRYRLEVHSDPGSGSTFSIIFEAGVQELPLTA